MCMDVYLYVYVKLYICIYIVSDYFEIGTVAQAPGVSTVVASSLELHLTLDSVECDSNVEGRGGRGIWDLCYGFNLYVLCMYMHMYIFVCVYVYIHVYICVCISCK